MRYARGSNSPRNHDERGHLKMPNIQVTSKLSKAKRFFSEIDAIAFAYAFGSVALGTSGPLSDLDFAVFLHKSRDPFTDRLKLIERLGRAIGADRIDLTPHNYAPLLLRYEVIKRGILLKDRPAMRVPFETATIGEFLDTAYIRGVQRRVVKEQLARGTYFG